MYNKKNHISRPREEQEDHKVAYQGDNPKGHDTYLYTKKTYEAYSINNGLNKIITSLLSLIPQWLGYLIK